MNGVTRSTAYLRAAIAQLPGQLAQARDVALPTLAVAPRCVVTSGIGASEGPARLLAAMLTEAGICARYCVTSGVARESTPADLLVMFSQGLSPNARLALHAEHPFGARWLVTSVAEDGASEAQKCALDTFVARGVVPIVVPPAIEQGTLVRFVGPSVAALIALRLAAALSRNEALSQQLTEAPACYRALGTGLALDASTPLALIGAGASTEWLYAQRWKLLETLLCDDPPVYEALQFAHGPLQAYYKKRLQLLVFESGGSSPLIERLARTLEPTRHKLLRLCSELAAPLSFFEHTATLDALLLDVVEREGRDLFDWPARTADGPLYDLGRE